MADVSSLVPDVPEGEVLGERRAPGFTWGRWVPWLLIGLLLLSVVWGLLVLAP